MIESNVTLNGCGSIQLQISTTFSRGDEHHLQAIFWENQGYHGFDSEQLIFGV